MERNGILQRSEVLEQGRSRDRLKDQDRIVDNDGRVVTDVLEGMMSEIGLHELKALVSKYLS